MPVAVTEDVTSVVKDAEGVYWIGTQNGLQRVNSKKKMSVTSCSISPDHATCSTVTIM